MPHHCESPPCPLKAEHLLPPRVPLSEDTRPPRRRRLTPLLPSPSSLQSSQTSPEMFHLRRLLSTAPSLSAAGPLACRLRSRSVIRLCGPDTVKFLQNLLTNDVRPLSPASDVKSQSYAPTPNVPLISPPPIYAAMLTPEGRFLYDLFLYRKPQAGEKLDTTGSGPGPEEEVTVLADVDADTTDELLQHLKKCRLRAKIDIENATEEFSCWQRFGSGLDTGEPGVQEPEAASVGWGKSVDLTSEAAAQGNALGWKWFKDPRLDILGFRGIFPFDVIPPLVESDKEAEEQHFQLWRIERGVPEGPSEIPKGEAIPLEYNLAGLNAISFNKGCYTGQELVARTHHRGVIRKRLLPLKFVDEDGKEVKQEVSAGSEVVDTTSDKKVGKVTTALGCRGMGLLRVEEVFKRSPATLSIVEKGDLKVEVIKPDWWPAEWVAVREEHRASA